MVEKILTIFIGKYVSVVTADFPDKGNPLESIKLTPYPMNPIRALFQRKYLNAPVMGGIESKDGLIYQSYILNPFENKVTEQRVRIVFTDSLGNKNLELASKVKDTINQESAISSLKIENAMLYNQLFKITEALSGMDIKGVQDKNLLMALSISKEAKKSLFTPFSDNYGERR